jgi:hypothetical protein
MGNGEHPDTSARRRLTLSRHVHYEYDTYRFAPQTPPNPLCVQLLSFLLYLTHSKMPVFVNMILVVMRWIGRELLLPLVSLSRSLRPRSSTVDFLFFKKGR